MWALAAHAMIPSRGWGCAVRAMALLWVRVLVALGMILRGGWGCWVHETLLPREGHSGGKEEAC